MANPILKVILTAVDEVSGVSRKAADSVSSFSDRAKAALTALGALGIGAALGTFFKSTIEEAANAEREMTRLGVALRNAGADVGAVAPKAQALTDRLALLAGVSGGDVMEALTGLITISGDVDGSMANMSLVMDLAAARGIDLGSAADIVGKAMNGNVTAFNKLGIAGKDATTVIEAARAQFGGFAEAEGATLYGTLGRLREGWDQFKEAVGNAILSGQGMSDTAGGLADTVAGLAKTVEANESAFRGLGDLVSALGEGFLWLVTKLGEVSVGFQAFKIQQAAQLQQLAEVFRGAFGRMQETAGKFLSFLPGAIGRAGQEMTRTGAALVAQATANRALIQRGEEELLLELVGIEQSKNAALTAQLARHHRDTEAAVVRHHGAVKEESAKAAKARLDEEAEAARERARLEAEATRLILKAAADLQQGLAKTGGSWVDLKKKVDEAHSSVLKIVGSTEDLEKAAKEAAKANADLQEEAEEAEKTFAQTVDSAASLGQSLISSAGGMGLMNDEAAGALTSVVNMGAAIAKFGIGSPEGLVSIVGALAQLIGGWGSSAAERARQEAHMKNTRAIEELSRDLGEYNGSTSGASFGGVLAALEESNFTAADGTPGFSVAVLRASLRSRGLEGEARKLAEKYGIDVDKDPGGWQALLEIMRSRKFGSADANFADQLASLTDSFGVLGTDDADDRIAAFRDFTRKNIPILADALQGDLSSEAGRNAAIARLRELYVKSINGQISPAEYKNATPQQFRQLVSTLLPLLGDANGILASGLSAGIGLGSGPVGGSPATGGTVGLAASPGAGLLGAPGLPTPNVSDAFAGLAGGSATTINGGVNVTIQIQQQDGESTDALVARLLREVDVGLAERFDSITAASGRVARVA